MKLAVIKTGGKQYKVAEGEKIQIEKLEGKEGKAIKFSDVLLVADGKDVEIGTPTVNSKKVEGTITRQYRDKKIMVVKYKSKTRYMKRRGHRQHKTEIEITKI